MNDDDQASRVAVPPCGHGWHFGGLCDDIRRPTIGDRLRQREELLAAASRILADVRAHVIDVKSGPREVSDIVCLVNVEQWGDELEAAIKAAE